jgi:hypothetical protein
MRRRIPWLTLVLLVMVLITVFEADLEAGHWLQAGFKLAGLVLVCAGIWGFNIWRRQR